MNLRKAYFLSLTNVLTFSVSKKEVTHGSVEWNQQVVKEDKLFSAPSLPPLPLHPKENVKFQKWWMTKIQWPVHSALPAYADTLTDVVTIAYTLSPPDGIVAVSCSFKGFFLLLLRLAHPDTEALSPVYPSQVHKWNIKLVCKFYQEEKLIFVRSLPGSLVLWPMAHC